MLTITILFIRNEKRQKELGLRQIYNLKNNRPVSGGAAGPRVSTAFCSGQSTLHGGWWVLAARGVVWSGSAGFLTLRSLVHIFTPVIVIGVVVYYIVTPPESLGRLLFGAAVLVSSFPSSASLITVTSQFGN